MLSFLNKADGSKVAIFGALFLAFIAINYVGLHLIFVDGPDSIPEIQFLEGIVQAVVYSAAGVSSVHVITGAVSAYKTRLMPGGPPDGAQQNA